MSKRRLKGKSYPPEFREQIVELHRTGRTAGSLAQEFGLEVEMELTLERSAELSHGANQRRQMQ